MLGSGGWSGVGGVWVEVEGDGVGFGGVQAMGLGSRRSEELGLKGLTPSSWGRVGMGEVGGVGVRGYVREVGVG